MSDLTKIYVSIPDGDSVGGESLWAESLGGDLYRIRSSPWRAFDLHFHDIVRALPDGPDLKPRVTEIVERSGHKTLRVIFPSSVSRAEQERLLSALRPMRASFERAHATLLAIDVAPEGDYQGVCDQLAEWERQEVLWYETGTT